MTRGPSAGNSISPLKLAVGLVLAALAGLYASGYFFLWAIRRHRQTVRRWRTEYRRPMENTASMGLSLRL